MHHHYADIRERLGPPIWWDENAVPRYCDFAPNASANIYAQQILLLLIECQNCGAEFKVCMSSDLMDLPHGLAYAVESDEIHYGDPPNAGCCGAGSTMNSVPRRVLEFWDKYDADGDFLWDARRRPELECEIGCDWADA